LAQVYVNILKWNPKGDPTIYQEVVQMKENIDTRWVISCAINIANMNIWLKILQGKY
jgi:hypothetical protein